MSLTCWATPAKGIAARLQTTATINRTIDKKAGRQRRTCPRGMADADVMRVTECIERNGEAPDLKTEPTSNAVPIRSTRAWTRNDPVKVLTRCDDARCAFCAFVERAFCTIHV